MEQECLGFLSRPTAQPPTFPLSPRHPAGPRPGLIGSRGSQATHASNKFQLQKLIRGPTALALKAPSVSSKSHGLGARERLLKVTLNTNRKHAGALTPKLPRACSSESAHDCSPSSLCNLLYPPRLSGLVFYPAPWGSLPTHLAEAVFITEHPGHEANPTPLFPSSEAWGRPLGLPLSGPQFPNL